MTNNGNFPSVQNRGTMGVEETAGSRKPGAKGPSWGCHHRVHWGGGPEPANTAASARNAILKTRRGARIGPGALALRAPTLPAAPSLPAAPRSTRGSAPPTLAVTTATAAHSARMPARVPMAGAALRRASRPRRRHEEGAAPGLQEESASPAQPGPSPSRPHPGFPGASRRAAPAFPPPSFCGRSALTGWRRQRQTFQSGKPRPPRGRPRLDRPAAPSTPADPGPRPGGRRLRLAPCGFRVVPLPAGSAPPFPPPRSPVRPARAGLRGASRPAAAAAH